MFFHGAQYEAVRDRAHIWTSRGGRERYRENKSQSDMMGQRVGARSAAGGAAAAGSVEDRPPAARQCMRAGCGRAGRSTIVFTPAASRRSGPQRRGVLTSSAVSKSPHRFDDRDAQTSMGGKAATAETGVHPEAYFRGSSRRSSSSASARARLRMKKDYDAAGRPLLRAQVR